MSSNLTSLSSLFSDYSSSPLKKKKKEAGGSMALGGGSMAQRNKGVALRHAKNA